MTYAYNSLKNDSNPISKTNKNNASGARKSPEHAIYIALSLFKHVPFNTEVSIKNEIKIMVDNIKNKNTAQKLIIEKDSLIELKELMNLTTINKFGSSEKIINQTNNKALYDITITMAYIEKYHYSNNISEDVMKKDFSNMLIHFDDDNIKKITWEERLEIAYEQDKNGNPKPIPTKRNKGIESLRTSYRIANNVSKKTTPNATTPNATTPNATTPNATTPNATTPNATTPNATTPNATTPNATTPDYDKYEKKIIGELIGYGSIKQRQFYRREYAFPMYKYYANIFGVTTPEMKNEDKRVFDYMTDIWNKYDPVTGTDIFDMNTKFSMADFSKAVSLEMTYNNISSQREDEIFSKLEFMNDIIKKNNNIQSLTNIELKSIITTEINIEKDRIKKQTVKTEIKDFIKQKEIENINKKSVVERLSRKILETKTNIIKTFNSLFKP